MTRLEWLIIHVKMRSISMGLCDLIVLRYRTHSSIESENVNLAKTLHIYVFILK